ncbi:MAG: T9SS type A sorting domain-containing protein [Bacteroidia bacterium]|nr:T9SS type A sorting domain-containing protein [Bacteroidia bacterium]
MKKALLLIICSTLAASTFAQFQSDGRKITGTVPMPSIKNPGTRSVSKPTHCGSDTSYFPNYGTTAFNTISVRNGSTLGQYFGANQDVTVSGFRFYGYSIPPSPARQVYIRLICNLFKAGADSLPSGSPLASDTITVDTVMGSSIPLARILREAVFKNPVTLNYDYIITVGCDSTNVGAGIVANNWAAGNGKKKNLSCGSVSGKWYRGLQLNIGGVTMDADIQLYPFVKYKLGANFNITNDCYNTNDTVKFQNLFKNNVSGLPYYNYYLNYGLDYYTQRWSYDGSLAQYYVVNGFYKPPVKKNFDVQLISVIFSYSSGTCFDTMIKTVYFKPLKPSLKSPLNACKGDTVKLNLATESGVTYKWSKAINGTPFLTGSTHTINNIQSNDTFYVVAENGNCKSPYLRIDLSVADYPNNPIVKNDSICLGAIANLSATTNVGTIEWFSAKTGGLKLFSGNDFQSQKLSNDTFFYVQANNKGCINKGGRALIKAFVSNSFAPGVPTVISDTFMCLQPSGSLDITATQSGTDSIRWFNQSSGGVPVYLGDTYSVSPKSRGDHYYYVETWNGTCGSGRTPVKVAVYDYPKIYNNTPDTICAGETAHPTVQANWGKVHWFDDMENEVYEGLNPTFSGLTKPTVYYLFSEENGCYNPNYDSILVLVNTAPKPTAVINASVCSKALGSMEVKVPSGKVNWYYDPADQAPFFTGQKISTGLMLGNVTYYYETENKGCVSEKTPLTVAVKPRPIAGFTWTLQWQNKLVCTPITTTGQTVAWEWGDGAKSTGSPFAHVYSQSGNYTVRMIATSNTNGCKDTADIPVIIDHTGVQNIVSDPTLAVYPNPISAGSELKISGLINPQSRIVMVGLNGTVVFEGYLKNDSIALPSNLKSGVYVLRIIDANAVRTSSVVVGN